MNVKEPGVQFARTPEELGVASSHRIAAPLLVDVLVSLKSRAGLVLICSLVLAALGLLAGLLMPGMYRSTAAISFSDDGVAAADTLMRTAAALDIVAGKLPEFAGMRPEESRRNIAEKFEWSWPVTTTRQKAKIFFLDVRSNDAARAQKLAHALIDTWIELSKPRPDSRQRLQSEIERLQTQWNSSIQLIKQYESEAKNLISPNSLQGELARPLSELIAKREDLSRNLAQKQEELRGVSRDVILSGPTLPTESEDRRRPVKWALLGALLGLLAAAAYLLASVGWRHFLTSNPEAATRLHTTRWGVFGKVQ